MGNALRLLGIDAPESEMPYGKEAKEELTKLVQGKCLRVLVFDQDQYGRSVGDVYCNGIFIQESMLKKGLAWHYKAYDQRPELEKVMEVVICIQSYGKLVQVHWLTFQGAEREFYFPQGHMEQLEASTNQELNEKIPHFNLPSKVLYRVINVHLWAEQETDEVYAQITLVPEQDQTELENPDSCSLEPPKPTVYSFYKVPEGLSKQVVSSKKAQANWYKKLSEAWRESKPPPRTPEEASRLIIQILKRNQKANVEGLLTFYGLPLPHTLVELSAGPPTSLPEGLQWMQKLLRMGIPSVYVSTMDPRESSSVPIDVQIAAVERSKARAGKNYAKADALQKQIVDSGYRVLNIQSQEILARKYRIRLRGIDAPESAMPYGKEAKEELTKLVQGKCLRVLVFDQDRYGRFVGDIYCNGIFIQWEKEARAKRVGLWASSNPEMPWEWRKDRREGR
ncbi:hypothetical protein HYC85_000920 [Camellia sinensis]|uniref:TNase-like domain-containing protein n=1 Tax=Camellia sinensis TaxID=4442 RepID=A0A7J7I541_CAMSI|nr:hypothetical protein HYC85_000920 [Camellia sinensis]